jgi:tRNA G46 methylase TrmB
MRKVVTSVPAIGTTSITMNFTHTKRDEKVNPANVGGNYVLDPYGDLYQITKHARSCTITVIGGDGSFMHDKAKRQPNAGYITSNQIVSLHEIFSELAMRNIAATINDGNSKSLAQIAHSVYDVYRS